MTAVLETVAFLIETWHLIYSAKKNDWFLYETRDEMGYNSS